MSDEETVVVVGAGLAGLFVAHHLRLIHKLSVLVLEASERPGGMVKTVYDDAGCVKYEAGPWRVFASHKRVIKLCETLGVNLRLGPIPPPTQSSASAALPGLSEWDVNALHRRNPLSADHADLSTGCASTTDAQSGCQDHRDLNQYVSDDGFSDVIKKLADGARILCDTRVVDIRRVGVRYNLQCRCRADGGFVNRTYTAITIFICVPPHAAERWTILSQWARAQLYAVQSRPLNCIYGRTSAPTAFHMISPTSLLGQGVASQYKNQWFQVSCTGGRLARFWHRLQTASPKTFVAVLVEEVRRSLHVIPHEDSFISHFREHAHHVWRPSPMFDIDKAVRASVMPNPKHLPNVFWCGEAFSGHQGWMEGALETAQLALDMFTKRTAYVFPRRLAQAGEVTIEGRVLDVSTWADLHPGGADVIRHHQIEDVTDLFYHTRHGKNAWAVVHAMQVAVEL